MTSNMTFFCKFIFTTIWIGGFGIGATITFAREGDVSLFIPWIIGSLFIWLTWGRLKKIAFSQFTSKLYISNFIKEIEVPSHEVEDISAFPLITPGLVVIRFKTPTNFGKNVMFMPSFKPFSGVTVYTKAEELRKSILGK